eukprot:PhM_4_TR651/c1_g1_i1/m.74559
MALGALTFLPSSTFFFCFWSLSGGGCNLLTLDAFTFLSGGAFLLSLRPLPGCCCGCRTLGMALGALTFLPSSAFFFCFWSLGHSTSKIQKKVSLRINKVQKL